jgi:hypothetical protein
MGMPRRVRQLLFLAAVSVAALTVVPGSALAVTTTYYVNPSGPGTACSQAAPCSLTYFSGLTPAAGDTAILAGNDGTYGTATSPLDISVSIPAGVTLMGASGQPRPVWYTDESSATVANAGTVSDLDVEGTALDSGVVLEEFGGSVVNRVIADAPHAPACQAAGTTTITDTICTGGYGFAVNVGGSASLTYNVTLRNTTLYGSTIGMQLMSVGPTVNVTASNSIIHSAGANDITATATGSSVVTATLDHSSYSSVSKSGATVTAAGTATNQTAAPLFVNAAANNFHEAVGSPTIDAGANSALNGVSDLDGNPRDIGVNTDIGAYEQLLAPVVATGASSGVSGSGATVGGSVDPNEIATTYDFQYGTTTAYGSTSTAASAGAANAAGGVSTALAGLAAGTTYHFRLVATNAAGTNYGADATFTTLTATLSGLAIAPGSLFPAQRGASATAASAQKKPHPKRRRIGATVSYTLNEAATVTFTVTKAESGRLSKTGGCVARTHSNRHAHHCTRTVTLTGSFVQTGIAGANGFEFTGRLNGHTLAKGSYSLVATPSANGLTGTPQRTPFKIND